MLVNQPNHDDQVEAKLPVVGHEERAFVVRNVFESLDARLKPAVVEAAPPHHALEALPIESR